MAIPTLQVEMGFLRPYYLLNFIFTGIPDGNYSISYTGGSFTNVVVLNNQATVVVALGTYDNLQISNGTDISPLGIGIVVSAILPPYQPNAKPLANIEDIVELTLFEAVRQECVSQGYLPNINDYANTSGGFTAYTAAIKAIATSKGFAIEVFNNSSGPEKGWKKVPRFVLISENFIEGTVGLSPSPIYIDAGTDFTEQTPPPQTLDFTLRIHLVCETNKQLRIMTSILANAIVSRGYLNAYIADYPDEVAFTFFLQKIGFNDVSSPAEGLIEKVHRYQISDLLDVEYLTKVEGISKLIEITLQDNQADDIIITQP